MYIFCIIMICIASILLILAVLVQSPKSGMAANFGAANQTMGVRQTTDFLEKFTWAMVAAVVFFSLLSTTANPRIEEKKAADVDYAAEVDKANGVEVESEEQGDVDFNVTPEDITALPEGVSVKQDAEVAEPANEPVAEVAEPSAEVAEVAEVAEPIAEVETEATEIEVSESAE